MHIQRSLDSLPVAGVFLALVLGALLGYECGFRVGRWWQNRTPEEKEGPTSMIVGSLLALLAFLLAISMGMASDRFEARRGQPLHRLFEIRQQPHRQRAQRTLRQPGQIGLIELRQVVPRQVHGPVGRFPTDDPPPALLAA